MEGLSIVGNSFATDMLEDLIQKMEHMRIDESFLDVDMPELNKSTKAAQETHSENKNEEVAEPELDSVIEFGTGAVMSMEEIFGVTYFDPSCLKERPCYDNVVIIDVDEARLIRITGITEMLGTLSLAHEMIKEVGRRMRT